MKFIQLFQSDTVDVVLQKHKVCVAALALAESFMPQFFLGWGQ